MTLQELQEKYPTKELREEAVKHLTDEEIDKMIAGAGIVQAKIEYSRLKKRNQIRRYKPKYNKLATAFLNDFLSSDSGNVVFSPFSVLMLMSIAADAVEGDTRQEILNVIESDLQYEDYRNMVSELQRLLTEIVTVISKKGERKEGGEVVSANAVCVKEEIKDTINREYEERLAKYQGRLFVSKNIVEDVNTWVKENTKGMIENVADDSMSEMVACLMNAIAFEAEWEEDYDEEDIYENDEFTDADGNLRFVNMLSSTESTYIENEKFTGFVKPYKGSGFSYMALLPKESGKEAMKKAAESLNLSELFETSVHSEVNVSMPEFNYDYDRDLTDMFKKMGIETLFSLGADFSPLSSEWLKMDAIMHKAHIEVDRKGTKAAAVTIGAVVCGCALEEDDVKSVYLDRPFIYAIMHNATQLPVFVGVTNDIGEFDEDIDEESVD